MCGGGEGNGKVFKLAILQQLHLVLINIAF